MPRRSITSEILMEARELRTTGKSPKEIALALGIASSTAFLWTRDIKLSVLQREQLRNQAKTGNTFSHDAASKRRIIWLEQAGYLWEKHNSETLFMLGIGLYWGEGTKRARKDINKLCMSLANSDPLLIKVWIKWCRNYIPETGLHLRVVVHDGLDHEIVRTHWKKQVDWDEEIKIYTAVSIASKRLRPADSLPYGTATVIAGRNGLEAACKILYWINRLQSETETLWPLLGRVSQLDREPIF